MNRLKTAIQSALPLMAVLAAMSPNKYDDLVVKLLQSLLNDEAALENVAQSMTKASAA